MVYLCGTSLLAALGMLEMDAKRAALALVGIGCAFLFGGIAMDDWMFKKISKT
jgi:hypothetical protein